MTSNLKTAHAGCTAKTPGWRETMWVLGSDAWEKSRNHRLTNHVTRCCYDHLLGELLLFLHHLPGGLEMMVYNPPFIVMFKGGHSSQATHQSLIEKEYHPPTQPGRSWLFLFVGPKVGHTVDGCHIWCSHTRLDIYPTKLTTGVNQHQLMIVKFLESWTVSFPKLYPQKTNSWKSLKIHVPFFSRPAIHLPSLIYF